MRFARHLYTTKTKIYLAAGVLLLTLSAGLLGVNSSKVHAQDCDNNAIIHCGFQSASQFIQDVQNNSDDLGHHDLHNLYANYGLVPADYTRFVSSARLGTAYKDGRVVVDGQTVATNSSSIGRLASFQGSGYFTKAIYGVGTYYGNTNQQAFHSDSIPVMVMFNNRGVMQFAVLTSCGNPLTGTPVTPAYSCNAIHKTPVPNTPNTYSFTASGSASGNASITHYTYNFGDGSAPVVTDNGATAVVHTYTKPGNYKATVTITVSLPGNQTVTATSLPCSTPVSVVAPFYSCVQLTGAFIDKNKFSYSFNATASYGNGATFKSADFNFGDKQVVNGVTPVGTTVSTTHTYGSAGNYTITATLHFNANGVAKNVTCTASVTPTQPPTPECKPGVPEGSALCTPCQYNSQLPSNSSQCVAPTTSLPNTGAGDVIAIFGAVVVAGFLIFRQFVYRKHRMAADSTTAMNLGHHMVAAAQKEDQSSEMIQHLTHADDVVHRPHPNAAGNLHHPNYRRSNRFRPGLDDK